MKNVIGITGSIGSGKSFAIEKFKKICKKKNTKAIFIDVDDVRRNILAEEKVDRIQLNKKIYSNKNEMEKYKKFINPKMRNYLLKQIEQNDGFIFIEWALLIEDNLFDLVDSIIMIYCDKETQIKRLEGGDLGKEEIIKRIKLQLSNNQKIKIIKQLNIEHYIINTSKSPDIAQYENILRKEGI